MSSGPAFAPDQALSWEYKAVPITEAKSYLVAGWRVMRVQVFNTGAVALSVRLTESEIPVVAGGCLELEPNGYMTTAVAVAGVGITVEGVIEFLYPVQPSGISPSPP